MTSASSPRRVLRFLKRQHLRNPAEFKHVYGQRCAARFSTLIVFGASNGLPHSRIGLSISRKHGNAVYRNRWKRRMREAFRLCQQELPTGLDLVFVPERGQNPSLDEMQQTLRRATKQIVTRLAKRT